MRRYRLPMRLIYFGSGAFGLPTLESLARNHTILGIVTQPDRPAGRGGALTPTPIAAWAAEHLTSTCLWKPDKVNTPETVAEIRALKPDAFVVIAFGQKLGKPLLDGIPAINLHASLLPRWRGAAPIHAAILAGDAVTGNSVITLADRMDAGLVLAQSTREIGPIVTAGDLHDTLAVDGPPLVLSVIDRLATGDLRGATQDESKVTLAPKLSREMAWMDPSQTAEECRRRVNGLSPWPGVTATLRIPGAADQPIKLLRVQAWHEKTEEARTGRLIDADEGTFACGHGTVLRLLEVQPPGKRSMAWADFARGRQLPEGCELVGGKP